MCLAVLGSAVAACSSTPQTPSTPPVAAQRLSHLHSLLPSGFGAPGRSVPLGEPQKLVVEPVHTLNPAVFQVAPVPTGKALQAVLAAAVNQPFPLDVRPLFVKGAQVSPGGDLTVVATHLGGPPNHDALFILQGPANFRAERLVQVRNQVSAGTIILPTQMSGGPWYVIVQDLSGITTTGTGAAAGTVLVDIGELTVTP